MPRATLFAPVICICLIACADRSDPPPVPPTPQPAPRVEATVQELFEEKEEDGEDGDEEMIDKIDVKNLGVNKALNSQLLGAGPLQDIFASDSEDFASKMNIAMSGEGGELVVGRGAGGEGFGRIGGLGRSDSGGRRGRKGGGKRGRGAMVRTKISVSLSGGFVYKSNQISKRAHTKPSLPMQVVGELGEETPNPVAVEDDFQDYGINPMVSTAKDKLSTFAVDVDTGAYTIGRKQLESGSLPSKRSVRVEEYINYFAYNYPAPSKEAFSVSMEAAPSPFEATPGRYLLRVGVQGKRVAAKERKPLHLTFLVDVSGSMSSVDKLPLAQKSLKILTNTLREGDTVSMVTYAGNTRVVLPATDAAYKGRILAAIDDLNSGGGTAMESGMELAYKQALSTYKKGHVNRVIVLSDGDANIGNTGHPQILKSIKSYVDEGVTLSTIGFGMGNYKDTLMEQLANKGNGNYYYVDSQKEANKVFGEQASGTLEVIAKDVKLQVEFDPDKVSEYRLVGYENRDIADRDFRNDKVDAGEIGAGHTVTAFYEVVFKGAPSAGFATVRVRHKAPEGTKASEQAFVVTAGDMKAKVGDASKDFQFGASVVAFAEILRQSPYAKGLSLALVEELATSASSPNQKDRLEFIELVKKARTLFKG